MKTKLLTKLIKSSRFSLIVVAICFLTITSFFYHTHVFSFHFVDEEDNFVLGKYLLSNEKLYSDLFSHHQPLAYIFSASVQKITNPNSIFLLIKRHREVMIIWSFVWSVILVARFGRPLLLTIIVYEGLKYFLLGYLFLAESIFVYPFLYLLSTFFLKPSLKIKFEYFFMGICFGLSFLLLSPLWPVLFILLIIFIKNNFSQKDKLLISAMGLLLFCLICLPFISLLDYFIKAFYINFGYYIPLTTKQIDIQKILEIFFAPLLLFNFEMNSATAQVMRLLSGVFMISSFILIRKNRFRQILLIWFLLGLTNLRFVQPGMQEYSGFHILPWSITLIFFTFAFLDIINWQKVHLFTRGVIFFCLLVLAFVLIRENQIGLFNKQDQALKYYINYSRQIEFGQAIQAMKDPKDTLVVVPDEWLIYWQANIQHASFMINYYAWMSYVPALRLAIESVFQKTPPTFFYCDCKAGYFGLEKYFSLYQPLNKDGQTTKLLVLKSKLAQLSDFQKERLAYYRFRVD